MDVETFIEALGQLSVDDLEFIAHEIDAASASAAGEVAWWQATVEIERLIRQRHRGRLATMAAHRAARAVLGVADAAGLALPNDRVTSVARAAAEIARGLVAGGDAQVGALLAEWRRALVAA